MPDTRSTIAHHIGELCTGGDWACAHGDFAGLRQVAIELQEFVSEPIHCQLVELASACIADPDRAGALWCRTKQKIHS